MPDASWPPPLWDDYIAGIIGQPPNPLADDPEPAAYGGTDGGPTFHAAIPATPEAVDELSKKRLDDALAKGTGPYPEGARTDQARITKSASPLGTIGQIGHEGLGGPQEAPLGWQGLSPDEESQIEIDGIQAPPLLGEVDAVSSPAPSTVAQTDVAVTGEDRSQPAPAIDDMLKSSDAPLPSMREREDDEDAAAVAARMKTPEEQAMFLAKIEQSRDNFAATRALEESEKNRHAAEETARIRAEAIKKTQERRIALEADAKKIADTDPMSTIPGYRKLFGVLAAFVGGFAANKTGRNVGLEMVNSIAEDAAQAQAQKLGLVNKQIAGVGEDAASAENAYHVAEAARIATYDAALKGLQSEVQLYDPKGTQAARIMGAMNEIAASRAAALAKADQQNFDNSMKAGDLALKARDQGLKETKFLTDEQRKAAAAALGAGVKQSPEFWEAFSAQPGVPGRRPPMAMTQKEFDKWLDTAKDVKTLNKGPNDKSEDQLRKEAAEATKAEAEAGAAQSGYAIASPETGDALKQKDGTPFVVMDTTERSKLRGITSAAVNIRRLADKIEEVRKKTGGGSKTLGTDDYQELQSLAKAVDFETYKAFDLGAPSAGDQEMAQGIKGGVDVTSFLKDPKKGLQTYADSVEKKALTHLRGAGYTGPALKFHRTADLKKAEPTVVDEIGGKLTTSLLKVSKADPNNPIAQGVDKFNQAIVAPQNKETDQLFQQLAAYAEQSNEQGDLAKKYLRELSEKAVYPDAKKRAKAILDSLPGAHVRGDEAR